MKPHQRHYDQVAQELRGNAPKPGLWLRAWTEAEGDHTKAKAIYVGLRIGELMGEEELKVRGSRNKKRVARNKMLVSGAKLLVFVTGSVIVGVGFLGAGLGLILVGAALMIFVTFV